MRMRTKFCFTLVHAQEVVSAGLGSAAARRPLGWHSLELCSLHSAGEMITCQSSRWRQGKACYPDLPCGKVESWWARVAAQAADRGRGAGGKAGDLDVLHRLQ